MFILPTDNKEKPARQCAVTDAKGKCVMRLGVAVRVDAQSDASKCTAQRKTPGGSNRMPLKKLTFYCKG